MSSITILFLFLCYLLVRFNLLNSHMLGAEFEEHPYFLEQTEIIDVKTKSWRIFCTFVFYFRSVNVLFCIVGIVLMFINENLVIS